MARVHIQDGSEDGVWVEDTNPIQSRNDLLARYGLAVLGGNILSPSNLLFARGNSDYREPDYAGLYADPAFVNDPAFASALREMTQQDRENFMNPDAPGNGNGGGGLLGRHGAFSDPEFWGGLASVALPGIGNYLGLSAEAMAAAKAATAAATGGNPLLAAAGSYATGLLPDFNLTGGYDLGGGLSVDGYGNVTGGTGINTGGSILPDSDSGSFDLGGGLSVDGYGNVTGGTGTNTGGSILPEVGTQFSGGVGGASIDPNELAAGTPVMRGVDTTNVADSTIDPNDLAAGNPQVNAVNSDNQSQWGSSAQPTNAGGTVAGAATAAASGTALSRILDGTASTSDWLSVVGGAGIPLVASALGVDAANKMTDAYKGLADQWSGYGAASRTRYEDSFKPGFTMANDPGYTDSLAQASKANLAALSTQGNPALNPNAQAANMLDLQQKTAYPALQNYRNTNMAGGGLASFAPASQTAATASVSSQNNAAQQLGAGIQAFGNIFNPAQTNAQQLQALLASLGKTNNSIPV